jgi:hypothetical protein
MWYMVILDVRAHGSAYATTEDIIEADSAEQAERQAIDAWRALRPDRTFHPLLTLAAGPNQGGMTWQ